MKTLTQIKNKQLFKISIPSSLESWNEYILAENEDEAKIAQNLLELDEYKLEYLASMTFGLDKMWVFGKKENKE